MVKTEEKTEKYPCVDSSDVVLDRTFKRTLLCVAKPSYLLGLLGPKTSRSEYLKRLPKILRELISNRNWRDASRVLSVLMQGTMRDGSPTMNRLKYEAQIQILSHLQPFKNNADEIGKIYDTWIGKIGKQHKEERLLVWFEQICHFIEHGMDDVAKSAVISMMQCRDLAMLPRTNLFIGTTFYRLWCRKFVAELQPADADCSESTSNMSETRSETSDSSGNGSAKNESESSVVNYTRTSHISISDVKVKSPQHFTNPPPLYETSEENEDSLLDGVEFDPALIRILEDMDPWLLPLTPPEDPDCYRKVVNDSYYKEAVTYLRRTMQSPHHVSLAALHPLVQLLLIGGHVDEAMKVVEEMCNKVHDIKPFRIKAAMTEKFHSKSNMLAKCYEDILNIDPNCVTTLKKLIGMCLQEMIALHVEASFPEPDIWKEFASCLRLLLENLDEDRMSSCLNGFGEERNQQTYSVRYNPIPRMFTNTLWTLRAKWWLHRHFSPEILETERGLKMMRLMSYKAACASHIYGPEFDYVTIVYGLLENKGYNNIELLNFLRTHRRNYNNLYRV
ncbi:hypothetical protein EUTSA_v10028227mg [Eutrema salsugineum]|uniref:Uncharacterized protein n=1 Tax=Eutrema salsugineum TaxID=72664 RepID=V4NLT4_EUTSA|nr:hypothetical protein EUTSA_v10028227mg [Eutrema salsugineum]